MTGFPTRPAALRVIMLGDSLTSGYGLLQGEALPVKLAAALQRNGARVGIANAGIAGDTTAGGLIRLPYLLDDEPDGLLLALGANDVLRAVPPPAIFGNLREIVTMTQAAGTEVALLGMLAPPALGQAYGLAVSAGYAALAAEFKLPFYPFLLEGVALQPQFNQPDGKHPNIAGVAELTRRLTSFLLPVMKTWHPAPTARPAARPPTGQLSAR